MALLFVADEPVPTELLARTLNIGDGQVDQAIEILQQRLAEGGPLQVVQLAGGWQLCTRPEFAEPVAAFLKPQRQRLGRSLMEVLAIVAYRQPITMAEVDAARGVQSDYSLRQLLERRLLQEVGRRSTPGRPVLYGTTQQFLHQFNINEITDLPKLSAELTDLVGVEALAAGAPITEEENEANGEVGLPEPASSADGEPEVKQTTSEHERTPVVAE